jgi:hypothetical protein
MTAWQPIQTADRARGDKVWVFDAETGVVLARYVLIPNEQPSYAGGPVGHPGWKAIEFPSGELHPRLWAAHTPGAQQPDWPQV